MSTRVKYRDRLIIPAPFCSIEKSYQKVNGQIIGSIYNITLTGSFVAYKGSPRSGLDGSISDTGFTDPDLAFWNIAGNPPDETIPTDSRLAAILRKQKSLQKLFSVDGETLEIQSADATAPLKAQVRVNSITFSEGLWFAQSEYTVVLEADVIFILGSELGEDGFTQHISEAQENWTIETNEDRPESVSLPRTYQLTHSISATGKHHFDSAGSLEKAAWKQARDWVLPRLGFDSEIALSSGVISLPDFYGGFNHIRSENIDEVGGGYSVTEQFILASGNALEEFNVSVQNSQQTGLERVTIEGNITGLLQRDSNFNITSDKFTNADVKFVQVSGLAFSRAQAHTNETLNIIPVNKTIGKNQLTGTINYSFEFDNRPSHCIPGAKTESISIRDDLPGDVFAAITVLGRQRGSVLQDIGTKTDRVRTLNIELVMPRVGPDSCSEADWATLFNNKNPRVNPDTSGELNNIIDGASPTNQGFSTVFNGPPQESWEPLNGLYNYIRVYTYN